MADNPALRAKARMLAPARVVAAVRIKIHHTSSVARPKLSIRDWFHSQASDFISARIFSAGPIFHVSIHLIVTS
jgi:hypothetical protein